MKKYNPQFHKNIVDNIRQMAKAAGIETARTDEQLYDLWCESYYCGDTEAEILKTLQEEAK